MYTCPTTTSVIEDPSDTSNTQEADLDNDADQKNEAEINQAAAAVCEGYAVVCDNKAVNFANIDQDNDLIQANANNQEQNGGSDPSDATLSTIVEDPSDTSNTQEADLDNDADQKNEAEINQAAAAVCEGYAVVCDNKAVNFANIDQDNDLIQANANNQEQNGGSDPSDATLSTIVEDPSDTSNTQEADLDNDADQKNEAEINQAAAAVCEGYAVVCDNKAVNFANIDQDNDAIQANANNQYIGGSGSGSGNTQEAELDNDADQKNEAEINQAACSRM